jgi:hypothetical protein
MAVRNGRVAAEDRRSNALLSHSDRRSNSRPLRKPRESGPDAVAGAGVVAADQKNPLLRIKTQCPSSRGLRVSRDHLVHHKHRAPIRRNHPKKAELLAPREMVRNDGDVSAGVAVVGAVVVRRARRHNCGFAALSKTENAAKPQTTENRQRAKGAVMLFRRSLSPAQRPSDG